VITNVSVRNYQSLVSTDVEFGTLTVIVGPNDLGKSALFRAIKGAAEAQSGTDFITYGKTTCTVAITVDDDTKVVWQKGESVNRYFIQHPGQEPVTYDRVGREVPPDVDAVLQLSSVEFDKDLKLNLNFAEQDDPPFLIPVPGGINTAHAAKVLGDLTKLNLLFKAVREADSRRKNYDGQRRLKESDLEQLKPQLDQFEDIDAKATRVAALEQHVYQAASFQQTLTSLEAHLTTKLTLASQLAALNEALQRLSNIPDLAPVHEKATRYESLEQELRVWRAHESMETDFSNAVLSAQAKEDEAQRTYDELFADLDRCPLCDQPYDRDSAPHVHAS
jgi:DNA repair exonuclease SbcCD ATPase subunit